MARRTAGMVATIALLASGLTAMSASTPATAVDNVVPYCSAPAAAPPCLVSFTHDSTAVDPALYRVEWQEQDPVHGFYNWYVEKKVGGNWTTEMGSGEEASTFTTTFDFGTFNPRTFGALGSPQTADPVIWSGDSSHHKIQISGSPIYEIVGCVYDLPDPSTPHCPTTATGEIHGLLFGVVNNGDWIGDTEAQHELSKGTYNFRNTEIGEATPLLGTDPVTGNPTMVFQLANAHQTPAAATFYGEQHVRLPNNVLRVELGIPDPDTMTWSSLVATVSGSSTGSGTLHITPESGHDAMRIDLTDVTFSARKVTIKVGVIKPTAPTALTGKRKTSTTGFLDWTKSLPRGARPTGYQSKCYTAPSTTIITTSSSTYTYLTVKGLKAGKHYSCRVRARSKVGYSAWSSSIGRL